MTPARRRHRASGPDDAIVFWAVRAVPRTAGRVLDRADGHGHLTRRTRGSPPAPGSRPSSLRTKRHRRARSPAARRRSPRPPSPPRHREPEPDGRGRPAHRDWLVPDDPARQRSRTTWWSTSARVTCRWTTESDHLDSSVPRRSGLTNGTLYDVRVAAVSSAGTSAYTSAFSHTDGGHQLRGPVHLRRDLPGHPPAASQRQQGIRPAQPSSTTGPGPALGHRSRRPQTEQGVPLNMINDNSRVRRRHHPARVLADISATRGA